MFMSGTFKYEIFVHNILSSVDIANNCTHPILFFRRYQLHACIGGVKEGGGGDVTPPEILSAVRDVPLKFLGGREIEENLEKERKVAKLSVGSKQTGQNQ